MYNGLIYPNKQPGSLLAGASVYAVLYWIGFTYRDTFFLTAALVSFFTSALCTAIATMVVFRLAAAWSKRLWWALGCALAFGIGSTALPYAGTLQHDAMASAFLLLAFFFAERRPFATGLFAGLAVTTSALPIPAATAVVAVRWAASISHLAIPVPRRRSSSSPTGTRETELYLWAHSRSTQGPAVLFSPHGIASLYQQGLRRRSACTATEPTHQHKAIVARGESPTITRSSKSAVLRRRTESFSPTCQIYFTPRKFISNS